MSDETDPELPVADDAASLFPKTVGDRLREARLAQKLDLADVAQRTRVPLRHLQAIESGDYSSMPTPTYAVGFARAYARAVGEDEVAVARDVRGQVDVSGVRRSEYQPYDTTELPRAPTSGVMIGAIGLALLLLVAVGLWLGTDLFRGDGLDAPAPLASETVTVPVPPVTPAGAGQVTLVATDKVWVRIYDAAGQTLKQGEMAAGERYDVPVDANNPMINVGRPDKLQVLLNGSAVAPLGDGRVAIKDVPIGAAALAARATPAPTASSPTAPAPAPSASPSGRTGAASSLSPTTNRDVPPFFRPTPTPQPTRTAAAPASTGPRDTPPSATTAPAATPSPAPPGNSTGA